MSNKDRRDENGDLNCTGEAASINVYSVEDLDSYVKVNEAITKWMERWNWKECKNRLFKLNKDQTTW